MQEMSHLLSVDGNSLRLCEILQEVSEQDRSNLMELGPQLFLRQPILEGFLPVELLQTGKNLRHQTIIAQPVNVPELAFHAQRHSRVALNKARDLSPQRGLIQAGRDPERVQRDRHRTGLQQQALNLLTRCTGLQDLEMFEQRRPGPPLHRRVWVEDAPATNRQGRRVASDHIPVAGQSAGHSLQSQVSECLFARLQFLTIEQYDTGQDLARSQMEPDPRPVSQGTGAILQEG